MSEDDEKPSDREDLTRIEDLGEYLHQEEGEGDAGVEGEEAVPAAEEFSGAEEWGEEGAGEAAGDAQEDAPVFEEEGPAEDDFAGEDREEEAAPPMEDGGEAEGESAEDAVPEEGEWAEESSGAEESLEESAVGDAREEEAAPPLEEEFAEEGDGGEVVEAFAEREDAAEGIDGDVRSEGAGEESESEQGGEEDAGRESFEDLRHFAGAITYGNVAARGTPPFTIIVNNIVHREDADGIMALLRDHNICTDENRRDYEQGIAQGAIIIPQISEYSAVYLAHKLRRFDVDIQMGLSDEIRPSPSYEREGRGLVSKHNFQPEIREEVSLEKEWMDLDGILTSTTSSPDGHEVREHCGVVAAHVVMGESEFLDESEEEWNELSRELKYQAAKRGADGVVDIERQSTRVALNTPEGEEYVYKVTCIGNAVLLEKE